MTSAMVTLKQLDKQVLPLKKYELQTVPKQGWARTIRKALGMTIKQLGRRLSLSPSRITQIERSELEGTVTLKVLRMMANAFGCILVYHFVPKTSFEQIVKQKARDKVIAQLNRTAHTMDLEAQSVDKAWIEEQVNDLIDELLNQPWKNVWEE